MALGHAGARIRGATAAVVGCGGAGKAAAVGLQMAGADVTLVNRGEERGRKASMELRLPFLPLAELDPGDFQILVQATSLGSREGDELPLGDGVLRQEIGHVIGIFGKQPEWIHGSDWRKGFAAHRQHPRF